VAGWLGCSGWSTVRPCWQQHCWCHALCSSCCSSGNSGREGGAEIAGQRRRTVSASPCRSQRRLVTGSVAAALVYLTVDTVTSGPLARLEARSCRESGPAPWWARWASLLAEKEALACAALAVVGHRSRRGEDPVAPVARLVGGAVARALFATAVRRPRPPEGWWRAEPHGWSLPSRHTTHALLAAGMLLDEVGPRAPAAEAAAVFGFVGVVAASRVRLGVHWPTDVVSGALTAILWRRVTAWTDPAGQRFSPPSILA